MATPIPQNRASFTLSGAARASAGEAVGDPALALTGVTSDSRSAVAGNLYVALRGEQHDGHRFVADALRRGAVAALVSDRAALPAGSSGIVVSDTLHAFGELAAAHRRSWGGRVVAITGSAGKTTTKELTFAALRAAGARVVKSEGNLNNLVGAPASLLALDANSDLAVIEIGTSSPGEIARLSAIAQPDIGVVTCVSVAHTAGLGSLELVAAEKAALLWALPDNGAAVYRADDAALALQLGAVRAQRRLGFGLGEGAAVRLVSHALTAEPAMACELQLAAPARSLRCELALFGEGPAFDAAAAVAVVLAALGADALDAAAAGLRAVLPLPGRLQPRPGPAGALILDDSYNANPASMRASIGTAIELSRARGGRVVLVLGDMLELGALSRAEHAALGVLAAQREVSALIACGPEMTAAVETAREQSQVMLSVAHLADAAAAPDLLRPLLRAPDVVLVKGSRGMAMERVVQALAQGPEPGEGSVIYHWLYPLHEIDSLSFLNVLRYVPFRVLASTMTAMLLTFGLYPWFIRTLQSRQIGQVVRKDGPASHLSKAGTPTMGGSLILLALIGATVLWADPRNTLVWVVCAVTALYGAIGYVDDALKIKHKNSGGISMRNKLLLQFPIAIGIGVYLYFGEAGLPADWLAIRDRVSLPFVAFEKHPLAMAPWLYVAFTACVLVGTSSAVNLTDGLDGLAIGPVMINAGTYMILSYLSGVMFFGYDVARYLDIPSIHSAGELAVYCGAMIGAGVGFLWYNTYPAQVFMGDVGALALGGGLGAIAVLTKNEILSILIGGIFVIEAVSVLGQIAAFKLFGKRIFLMAPIHHHFEKKGWAEPKVIVRFWIISMMLAIAGLSTLKLR